MLSEFRTRLLAGQAESVILDKLLVLCCERGLLKARMRTRVDSTQVLAAFCAINRIVCASETLRAALNALLQNNISRRAKANAYS